MWIVIPAYNEAPNVGPLLERISNMSLPSATIRTIVVDDGSTDGTAAAVQKYSLPATLVVRHATNVGLGPTLRDGLVEAASRGAAEDVVITMDGDNTHSPESIPAMVQRIQDGADVVIASRYCPGHNVRGVPPIRKVLSLVASFLMRMRFPTAGLKDYTCGYRAYRNSVVQQLIASGADKVLLQADFQVMTELLLTLRRQGARFTEVPIVLDYAAKIGPTKMRVLQTTLKTLRLLVRDSSTGLRRG